MTTPHPHPTQLLTSVEAPDGSLTLYYVAYTPDQAKELEAQGAYLVSVYRLDLTELERFKLGKKNRKAKR